MVVVHPETPEQAAEVPWCLRESAHEAPEPPDPDLADRMVHNPVDAHRNHEW